MLIRSVAIFLFFAVLTSCSKGDSLFPGNDPSAPQGPLGVNGSNGSNGNVRAPFGTWKLVGYEDGKTTPYEINIAFKNEKNELGQYLIDGKSTVNFYFAYFTADFEKRTIELYGVGGTQIKGGAAEMAYEENYWIRLSKVVRYEITDDSQTLILHSPEKDKQKITYKLIKR